MPPYYAVQCVGKYSKRTNYWGIIYDPAGDKSGDWVYDPDLTEREAKALAAWWDKHPKASNLEVAAFCEKLSTYRNLPERINPSFTVEIGVQKAQRSNGGIIAAALVLALILLAILFVFVMSVNAESDQQVYLPLVMKFPVSPRPEAVRVTVYNAMGEEVRSGDVRWNELHVRVDALGCSSVYPGFVGVDREAAPPTYYHLECTSPDSSQYAGPTTGADVVIYLQSPMWWSDFAVVVYYPGGGLQTVMVKGPWWYGTEGGR